MKTSSGAGIVAVVWALVMGACGGGSSGGTPGGGCGVQPCGGDLTGTWAFTSECANDIGHQFIDCAGVTGAITDLVTSGMASFNADHTYSFSLQQDGHISLSIPTSCLTPSIGTTCDAFSFTLHELFAGDGYFSDASCVGSSVCDCTLTVANVRNDTGTWSAAGIFLTLQVPGQPAERGPYCVRGDEFHLVSVEPPKSAAVGSFKVVSDIVAVRQGP